MNASKAAGRTTNHSTNYTKLQDYTFAWWLACLDHLFTNPPKYHAPVAWWSALEYQAGAVSAEPWAA